MLILVCVKYPVMFSCTYLVLAVSGGLVQMALHKHFQSNIWMPSFASCGYRIDDTLLGLF